MKESLYEDVLTNYINSCIVHEFKEPPRIEYVNVLKDGKAKRRERRNQKRKRRKGRL